MGDSCLESIDSLLEGSTVLTQSTDSLNKIVAEARKLTRMLAVYFVAKPNDEFIDVTFNKDTELYDLGVGHLILCACTELDKTAVKLSFQEVELIRGYILQEEWCPEHLADDPDHLNELKNTIRGNSLKWFSDTVFFPVGLEAVRAKTPRPTGILCCVDFYWALPKLNLSDHFLTLWPRERLGIRVEDDFLGKLEGYDLSAEDMLRIKGSASHLLWQLEANKINYQAFAGSRKLEIDARRWMVECQRLEIITACYYQWDSRYRKTVMPVR